MATSNLVLTTQQGPNPGIGSSFITTTPVTVALDSAYSYGVGGDSVAQVIYFPKGGVLTEFRFAISAKSGTGSTDGLLNWEIRKGYHATFNYAPGSVVEASGTVDVTSVVALQWVTVTGLNVTLLPETPYQLVLGDADGNTTNFITLFVLYRPAGQIASYMPACNASTAGWTAAGTSQTYPLICAVRVDGKLYLGGCWRGGSTGGNTALRRGFRLVLSPSAPRLLFVGFGNGRFNYDVTLRVYKGAASIPNDPGIFDYTFPGNVVSTSHNVPAYLLPNDQGVILEPGETYYVTIKPAVNSSAGAGKNLTFSNLDDDLRAALFGIDGVTAASAIEVTGGASWTIDTDALPNTWWPFFLPYLPRQRTSVSLG